MNRFRLVGPHSYQSALETLESDDSTSLLSLTSMGTAFVDLTYTGDSNPFRNNNLSTSRVLENTLAPNYVATLIFSRNTAFKFVFKVLLSFPDVDRIATLAVQDAYSVIEVYFYLSETEIQGFRTQILSLEMKSKIDICLQPNTVYRKQKRLFIFDMDSTLIKQECIDELARFANVYDQVACVTEKAMQGNLDFNQSLAQRVALLKGQPVKILKQVIDIIEFQPGARELCKMLKRLGYKLAVLSGGFMPFANHVKDTLGLDYAFANTLLHDGEYLKGSVKMPIINGDRKQELVSVISHIENIRREQVLEINRLWLLGMALMICRCCPKQASE